MITNNINELQHLWKKEVESKSYHIQDITKVKITFKAYDNLFDQDLIYECKGNPSIETCNSLFSDPNEYTLVTERGLGLVFIDNNIKIPNPWNNLFIKKSNIVSVSISNTKGWITLFKVESSKNLGKINFKKF